jgi:NAD dependent epimerase/dehydratase family
MEGVDATVHLAGIPHEDSFDRMLQTNVVGTYNVYQAACKQGCPRVVFASSLHVTGFYDAGERISPELPVRPDSFYGVSKACGENLGRLYADKHGLPGPGRAGLLALLAGEWVAAGVDDDPPAVAALLDHPAGASCGQGFRPQGGSSDDQGDKQGKPLEGAICALSCWLMEPEVGFEPTTFRLRVGPKSSNWTRPGPSWLLTCGSDSI